MKGKITDVELAEVKNLPKIAQLNLANTAITDAGLANVEGMSELTTLHLEKEVIAYASTHDISWFPLVRPTQLAGIEVNPYAQQLAQVVIWIGFLQWMHHNGFAAPRDPVLQPIESIRLMDAILDLSNPDQPKEPQHRGRRRVGTGEAAEAYAGNFEAEFGVSLDWVAVGAIRARAAAAPS